MSRRINCYATCVTHISNPEYGMQWEDQPFHFYERTRPNWSTGNFATTWVVSLYIATRIPEERFMIATDACHKQVMRLSLQEQLGEPTRPIDPIDTGLARSIRMNTSTAHRERIFAVVWAVLLLKAYLCGSQFTARVDHENMSWILKLMDPTGNWKHGGFICQHLTLTSSISSLSSITQWMCYHGFLRVDENNLLSRISPLTDDIRRSMPG